MRRLAGGFVPSICGLQGDDLVGLGHGRRRWVDRAGTRRIRLRHCEAMTSLNVVAAFQVRGLSAAAVAAVAPVVAAEPEPIAAPPARLESAAIDEALGGLSIIHAVVARMRTTHDPLAHSRNLDQLERESVFSPAQVKGGSSSNLPIPRKVDEVVINIPEGNPQRSLVSVYLTAFGSRS